MSLPGKRRGMSGYLPKIPAKQNSVFLPGLLPTGRYPASAEVPDLTVFPGGIPGFPVRKAFPLFPEPAAVSELPVPPGLPVLRETLPPLRGRQSTNLPMRWGQ